MIKDMRADITRKPWWGYMDEDLKELMRESQLLVHTVGTWKEVFHDYSFVVFPAAKAYEGFLKKVFLDLQFISEGDYYGKHFRLGKALNPNLEERFRGDDWVYEKLVNYCQGKNLADTLWETWRQGRNILFHWFPNEVNAISLPEAEDRINLIITAMDELFSLCSVQSKRGKKE